MVRLTLILVAVIFAVWLFFPSGPDTLEPRTEPLATAEPEAEPDERGEALATDAEGRLTLEAETGETLVIDAVVEPRAVDGQERVEIASDTPVAEAGGDEVAAIDAPALLEPVVEEIGESVASILDGLESAEGEVLEVLTPDAGTDAASDAAAEATQTLAEAAEDAVEDVAEALEAEAPEIVAVEVEVAEPAAPPPAPTGTFLQVSGDRVNFRAGPSTDDTILAALTRGETVELIERVADGWAHLRVAATGLEGYMSEDFLVPAPPPGTETAAAPAPPPPGVTLLQVAGDRVNFRAGPSTDNIILVALNRGDVVELIERVEDGWAHLRVRATGLEGYMSEDFLEPAN